MSRWTLYDPYLADTLTFVTSPKEGGEPTRAKKITTDHTTAGHPITYEGARPPDEISFKGVVRSTADRDTLMGWAGKPYQVKLTNDLGEERWIWIDMFTPTRKRVASRPFKAEYDIHGFVVDIP